MRNLVLSLLVVTTFSTFASTPKPSPPPQCTGVSQELTDVRKLALAPEIAKQLGVEKIEVLRSLKVRSWDILLVETHVSDEPFLFYSKDPLSSHYVTLWSGAARRDEGKAIRAWTLKNAPGIPSELASCFVWLVTEGQDNN